MIAALSARAFSAAISARVTGAWVRFEVEVSTAISSVEVPAAAVSDAMRSTVAATPVSGVRIRRRWQDERREASLVSGVAAGFRSCREIGATYSSGGLGANSRMSEGGRRWVIFAIVQAEVNGAT